MRKFVAKILLFLLPLAALAYPLDALISHFFKNSHDYQGELEVWNDIYNSRASCDIAIYGSSRAWVHFNPDFLSDSLGKSVYNFGIDGHNIRLQYLRHKEFLKYNKKPKYIILSLDDFTIERADNLYNEEQFLPYMLFNKDIMTFTSSYSGFDKSDYFIPILRYIGKSRVLYNTFFNCNSDCYRHRGFKGIDRTWNDDLDKAKIKNESITVQIDTSRIDLLETFIKECQNTGITLFFVFSPEYIEGQKYISNRNSILNVYKTLSQKYKLPFLNYSNDDICFNRSLFYNAMHLNATGANIFSKKLGHELKKLELIK